MNAESKLVISAPMDLEWYNKFISFINENILEIDEYTIDKPFTRWSSDTGTEQFMRISIETRNIEVLSAFIIIIKEFENDNNSIKI